ncbi:MAG: GNAT family N-acetyltransferase [Chloroflexota bacterium]
MNIQPLASDAERAACARIMATSDPWLTLGQTHAQALALMSMPDREMFVALDGDVVVGFAIIAMRGVLSGYLQTIAVAESYRGQGIGTQLMQFVETRIFRDKPNVFLFVSAFNTRAQKLYTALGYETIGVVRDFLVKGLDEILMRKTTGPIRKQ